MCIRDRYRHAVSISKIKSASNPNRDTVCTGIIWFVPLSLIHILSSLYGQQKGNQMKTPASGEKTFCTVETPKVYQIFTTDNMLWTGGNGTGLSYCLKYADDSTDENPVVLAKGVDENGKEFEQRIYINDVNPSNADVYKRQVYDI